MNHQKALHVLNLSEPVTLVAVQRQYKIMTTDLRQRIMDAPPHLRTNFEATLKEIEAAYTLLVDNMATDQWLPSAEKVSAPTGHQAAEVSGRQTNTNAPVFQSVMVNQPSKPEFLQKTGKWFFAGMIAALVLAVFFGIRSMNLQKELNKVKPLAESAEKMKVHFKNGKFKITNLGPEPVWITNFSVYYVSGDSIAHYLPTQYTIPELPQLLEPGRSGYAPVDKYGTTYDGEALFYIIKIENQDQTLSFMKDGICSEKPIEVTSHVFK